jgi:hypothetical protein
MDPDGKDQRAIYGRGESALEESLQGSQQAERRSDDGCKNTGRMSEKKKGSGGTDLLDGRKIRSQPVLQLSRLRPSEARLQTGVDVLQVWGSPHQGREEHLSELRQRGTERNLWCYRQTWGAEGKRQTYSRDVVLIQKEYCYMPTWVGWTKYGGGRTDKIATLVRTGRRSIELTQFTGPTIRIVVIEGEGRDIALANVYAPPKGVARRDSSSVREPPGQQKRKADHHRGGPQREISSIRGRRGGRQGSADHRSSRSSQPSGT